MHIVPAFFCCTCAAKAVDSFLYHPRRPLIFPKLQASLPNQLVSSFIQLLGKTLQQHSLESTPRLIRGFDGARPLQSKSQVDLKINSACLVTVIEWGNTSCWLMLRPVQRGRQLEGWWSSMSLVINFQSVSSGWTNNIDRGFFVIIFYIASKTPKIP